MNAWTAAAAAAVAWAVLAQQRDDNDSACGRDADQLVEYMYKSGYSRSREAVSQEVREHFARNHPAGEACHCFCGHKKPQPTPAAPRACGKDFHKASEEACKNAPEWERENLRKKVKAHFAEKHPEGECHCACGGGDGEPPNKPKRPQGDSYPRPNCGKDLNQVVDEEACKSVGAEKPDRQAIAKKIKEHFAEKHREEGECHCACRHDEGFAQKPGESGSGDRPGIKKPDGGPGRQVYDPMPGGKGVGHERKNCGCARKHDGPCPNRGRNRNVGDGWNPRPSGKGPAVDDAPAAGGASPGFAGPKR